LTKFFIVSKLRSRIAIAGAAPWAAVKLTPFVIKLLIDGAAFCVKRESMSSYDAGACPYGIAGLAGCLRKLACPSVECLTEVGTTLGLVEVEHFVHDLLMSH
jgi:hypothetical protein